MNNTAAAHCPNCSALFGAPVCGECCRERTKLLKTIAKITADNEKLRAWAKLTVNNARWFKADPDLQKITATCPASLRQSRTELVNNE